MTKKEFDDYANAEPATSAEVTSPRSVLPLTHDLFVYVFLFSLSYGFALRYEHADGGLLANGLLAVALAGIGFYALFVRDNPRADLAVNVVYTQFSTRDFGFDRTIATVEPPHAAPLIEVRYADSVEARCQDLASQYALTERESDVFALLVRGNNAAHIQEELVISKNTLKYHVRHIYEITGVHSQQELIDLL